MRKFRQPRHRTTQHQCASIRFVGSTTASYPCRLPNARAVLGELRTGAAGIANKLLFKIACSITAVWRVGSWLVSSERHWMGAISKQVSANILPFSSSIRLFNNSSLPARGGRRIMLMLLMT